MLNRIINMSPQGSLGSGMISILAAKQNGNLLANWQRAYWPKSRKKHSRSQSGEEEPAVESSVEENTAAADGGAGEEEDAAVKGRHLTVQSPGEKTSGASASEKGTAPFSRQELQKAIAMSVILGPPVCKKRKRYEGNTGRR